MFGGRKETEEVSKEAERKVYFKAQIVPKKVEIWTLEHLRVLSLCLKYLEHNNP